MCKPIFGLLGGWVRETQGPILLPGPTGEIFPSALSLDCTAEYDRPVKLSGLTNPDTMHTSFMLHCIALHTGETSNHNSLADPGETRGYSTNTVVIH